MTEQVAANWSETIDGIHTFWFGELNDKGLSAPEFHQRWFTRNAETDDKLRRHYASHIETGKRGELDDWVASDKGLMALIVLLDQFSRNIHRDTPAAFAADAKALSLAQAAIESRRHRQLPLIHRVFLYLPLEHSEDLDLQQQCVELFETLVEEGGEDMAGFARYAVAHREVIAKFGRFPHRNSILGRPSSQEEQDYLETHGGF